MKWHVLKKSFNIYIYYMLLNSWLWIRKRPGEGLHIHMCVYFFIISVFGENLNHTLRFSPEAGHTRTFVVLYTGTAIGLGIHPCDSLILRDIQFLLACIAQAQRWHGITLNYTFKCICSISKVLLSSRGYCYPLWIGQMLFRLSLIKKFF